ncbi:MAG: hypothetical protein WCP35_10030 [Verrucomicrobiota bacterium]
MAPLFLRLISTRTRVRRVWHCESLEGLPLREEDSNLLLTPTATVVFSNSSAKTMLSCSFGAVGNATISGTDAIIHVPASQGMIFARLVVSQK